MNVKYTDARFTGDLVNLLVGGRDTGGRMALISSVERSGCEPPLHRHRNEDELVYVLTGELNFYVNGEPHRVTSGDCLLLPMGVEHCYRVESEEARVLTVVMPSGLEDFYAALSECAAAADIERLVTVAATFGIEITGPPASARSACWAVQTRRHAR